MRAARTLGPGVYGYDDLVPGDRIDAGSRRVTAEAIDAFADLSGDRFDIHLDAEAARRLGYADRVAHGLLVLSMVDGLKMQAAATFRAVASLNWTYDFTAPVLVDDTIHVTLEIEAMRRTKRADRGILTLRLVVTNQRDEIVQSGHNKLMIEA